MRVSFRRTLIIKPSSMGDIVQALPVLTAIKEAAPEARVWWLAGDAFASLVEGHPRLAGVLRFDRTRYAHVGRQWEPTVEFARFLQNLRRRRFTTVLDLQGLFRSGLMALATGAPHRVGFRDARELAPLFYTSEVRLPRYGATHAVDRYLAVARHVGLAMPEATDHLPVSPAARQAARARLEAAGLAPGADFVAVGVHARWPTKQWPPERFAAALDEAWRDLGATAVLVGSGDAAEVAAAVKAAARRAPLDLTGQTGVKELVAILAEARAMLTNDSGPMHIAAAVGTPVVAVFGPTDPRLTGPYGAAHQVVGGRAACSPCHRRQCVLGGSEAIRCMKNIGAAEVAERVAALWHQA